MKCLIFSDDDFPDIAENIFFFIDPPRKPNLLFNFSDLYDHEVSFFDAFELFSVCL